jgi:hypothetical protein
MRRGFSATEVLVAAGIFAVALVPIITLIAGAAKPTAFNEYHIAAQAQAAQAADRMQDLLISRGFGELERMPLNEKVGMLETQTYKLPTDDPALQPAEGGVVGAPEIFLTNLSPNRASLIQISVIVNWTIPTENAKHSFTLMRLMSRPDMGLISDYQPKQVPGGSVKGGGP